MISADFADFDLEITRIARGRYRARVVDSPAGQASVDFRQPVPSVELENFILKIGRTRTGVRRIDSPEMQAAEIFGKKLFEAVFQGEVRDRLTACLDQIHNNQIPGLRIKLRLVGVPELANLPWEYLYHPNLRRFIVLSTKTPITRYIDLPRSVTPLSVSPPLRLLVMTASPRDYPSLDVNREKAKMIDALRKLEERGLIVVEWLEAATLPALEQRLRRHLRLGQVHLFHFIGHGGWDEQAQDGVLLFEDEHGRGHRVSASRLATILYDHESLRLVMLNACEGARASSTDPFAGVAAALIQQGIPAVVAMQFEITDRAAIQLASVFYESLADGQSVEAALAEARRAIFASGSDVEWGTPVLYLRAPDGRLFDLTIPSSREAERPAAQKAEADRLVAQRAEDELLARKKAEQERLEKEKAGAERPVPEPAVEERPAPRPPYPLPPPLPLPAVLFFNIVIMGVLILIIFRDQILLPPCRDPVVSALAWSVIFVTFAHLVWRYLRIVLIGLAGTITVAAVQIPLNIGIALFDALHLSVLSHRALWMLVLFVFGLAGALGLSPLSPFRSQEVTPVMYGFSVDYILEGTTKSHKPGDEIQITADRLVRVEAFSDKADVQCTWYAAKGDLQSAEGCSTVYSFPFGGATDSLAVLVQSACKIRTVTAGMSIVVLP